MEQNCHHTVHHCQEPGSIFSTRFSYAARLTGSLNHPYLLLSSWKNPCCLPLWLLCSTAFWLPNGFHLLVFKSLELGTVFQLQSQKCWTEIALLAPAQPWSSNGAQHGGGHLHLHLSLGTPHQPLQSFFTTRIYNCISLLQFSLQDLTVRFQSSLQFMSTALLILGNKK